VFSAILLKHYLETVEKENADGSIQFVLLSKSHLLGFYVNCGFAVNRPSPIVHGKELWYELERKVVCGLYLYYRVNPGFARQSTNSKDLFHESSPISRPELVSVGAVRFAVARFVVSEIAVADHASPRLMDSGVVTCFASIQ
jgi:hypothetical protein